MSVQNRAVRLMDETWEQLLTIAKRRGLNYGGSPSAARAIAALAKEEIERTEASEGMKTGNTSGSR